MGIFSKIKNILFEDEDEVEEMPVYTKDEAKENSKNDDLEAKKEPIVEEPITTSSNSHFRNVKRDIDLTFDEKDVLGEVAGASDIVEQKREEVPVTPPPVDTTKSPFLSFDEDEFERLNAVINRNETRAKKEVRSVGVPTNNNVSNNSFNRRTNNFSSTNINPESKGENIDRYKVNSGTLGSGKKPFTPSPVISPVYGILDKNYTKDDIVDRQGGLKREKVVKQEEKKAEEPKVTKIENNRNFTNEKSETLEKKVNDIEIPILDKVAAEKLDIKKNIDDFIDEPDDELISIDNSIMEDKSIDDQLDEKFVVEEIIPEDDKPELDEVVEKVIESKSSVNEEPQRKSKVLNDLEKTSTLQILDDIEKELNAIKPISQENLEDGKDYKERLENDTLENDLFNLIDSMYEEGEEDSND